MDTPRSAPDHQEDAVRLAGAAARLVRWLRAADPAPRLTGAQASALAVIVHAEGVTPSELARWEEVKRPTVARTLAQLDALGLLERAPSPTDGRAVRLRASDKGRRWFAEGQTRRARPLAQALAALPAEKAARLRGALPLLEQLIEEARRGG
ncbi:MAG: MarR family winged helix-turn-helix transcriptional regulator [Allosphingosinicella sp.]|uniref:MarR family winged helix-turn-helix transcriptional regulator n=1 Tax=Allosphingosinicella sp. TaxID=2823234 RepID=UPI003951211D